MPRHAHRALVSIVLALLVFLPGAVPALANFPGSNGQIAFQRFDADGFWQIWVANPDLTQQRQITNGAYGSGFAAWSPNGSRIAFQSDRSDPDITDGVEIQDVFTMRPDGSDVRKLTGSIGFSGHPSYSPDGRWIVYDSDGGNYPAAMGLYIVPSDGAAPPRRVTTLVAPSFWQELPRFSPDGTRIVWDEGRGGKVLSHHQDGRLVAEQTALFTVRVDGTDLRQVTPWGLHAVDPDWSPDGKRLVFASQPTRIGDIGEIMVADATGGQLRTIVQDHGLTGIGSDGAFIYSESFNPVWSPDGRKILFVHASYTAKDGFEMGLQTVNPDGTGRAWVSTLRGEEHQPEWGTLAPIP